ncbi:MAG: PstS family phosphate ABC transporter substrate-binding protein [Spirulina sp. SIO3F2]|nr:PstS family phosphate ABC transporter substrate-binding protein [Spirulina sp. SIO3F2]
MWLRGLLHCGSRNALAQQIKQDRERFREQLHTQLYPAISELTGVTKITSSKIAPLLEAQGYRRIKVKPPRSKHVPVTKITTAAHKAKSSFVFKVFLSGVGVILTIITGVIIETSTGLVTDVITGDGGDSTADSSDVQAPAQLKAVKTPTGTFRYGGSTTWATIRAQADPILAQAKPGFQFNYLDPVSGVPGSGAGIQMLLANQIAFAQSSRPLKTEEYQTARQRGFTLKEIPIAIDGIAVSVHPDLTIPGLSIAQLRSIYTGAVNNWQQVGGPNLPITAYSRDPNQGGTVKFFADNVLSGTTLGPQIKIMGSTTEAVRAVSQTPGSIYFASAPELLAQCSVKPLPIGRQANKWVAPTQQLYASPQTCLSQPNQINLDAFRQGDYPLTRRLFVVVKEDGQRDQEAGKAYATLLLTQEGQSLIEQLGFVSIRYSQ